LACAPSFVNFFTICHDFERKKTARRFYTLQRAVLLDWLSNRFGGFGVTFRGAGILPT